MAEEIKFTEEEVKQINDIRTQTGAIFQRIGSLEVEKARILEEMKIAREKLNEQLKTLRETETELFTSLNTKYGDGDYNPETNVFTPIKQEKQQEPVS